MKIHARFTSNIIDQSHHAHINLLVNNYHHVKQLDELVKDELYNVTITKVKSKRSINQNALMWSLLHKLEVKTKQDMMDWYIFALTERNCKSTVFIAPDNSEKDLLPAYRAVKKIGKRMVVDLITGKETEGYMYRCYIGTSKFNVSEMNDLLDTVIRYCNEEGIEVEEYDR